MVAEGGGFTGEYKYYEINREGEVYDLGPEGKYRNDIGVIEDNKVLKSIYKKLKKVNKKVKEYDRPGNLSRILGHNLDDEDEGRTYTWAVGESTVPYRLNELFQQVWEEIKALETENSGD